ncbi:transmembrane amino acid transporter [Colletotrichum fioriniae PJ7]|uniref:Transmembrane amino acid transporter n=2 Tax=Colletotrichum fioriniae TaxID=710243 RepID=A0A010QAB8_9PEZI|nr:transmembrane amino acid transporter [Colletotrichum fioriniae PJ7]
MASPSRDPLSIPRADSPSRQFGSLPRADATARLASPVPSQQYGTPQTGRFVGSSSRLGDASETASLAPLAGAAPSSVQGPGVSALAAALSNSLGTSPPRHGTPPVRSATPPARPLSPAAAGAQLSSTPMTNYGSFDSRSRNAGAGAYEDPEIVKRHLVQPTDAASEESSMRDGVKGKQTVNADAETGLNEDEFSSLQLQGGDVTRGIYKWTEEAEARNKMQRSKSFSVSRPDPETDILDINTIKVPGGFRRNYLRRAARSPSTARDGGERGEASEASQPRLLTSSFLEFLSIYGHFAGEELEEDDEALRPGEYFSSGEDMYESDDESDDDREPMEDSALLTPSRHRRRRKQRGGSGKNSPMSAALLLLKSFVGTGVLFLPRAYLNGGMVFSNAVLLGVAALSYYCFVLLVTTRLKVDGSFGDLGGILYGKWMRATILSSIVISQIGFVAAYMVFTSENLQAVILAVSDCKSNIAVKWLILLQVLVFLPFSLLRDIEKLSFTALIADAFILLGLAYLLYYDILTLATNGIADIIQFNRNDWTLFIGTAIFTFEGIGLIIPIQESMKNPSKFPRVMLAVMIIISVIFIGMGAISYAAYGSKTETVVLLNMPQDNKAVNSVQFLYSIAIMLSIPLQLFPAIKITENALFTKSGKYNPYIKWQKNLYRFFFVILCAVIAWGGADDLDKFVALVGNFACIPLVYIYPPLLHYKAVARNRLWKISDIILCIFGFVAMAYTTTLTVYSWAGGSDGAKPPAYCDQQEAHRHVYSSPILTVKEPELYHVQLTRQYLSHSECALKFHRITNPKVSLWYSTFSYLQSRIVFSFVLKVSLPPNPPSRSPSRITKMNAPDRFELFLLGEGEKKIEENVFSGMSNTSDFVIKKEDHTLGNLLSEHLKMHKNVLMAGYKIAHPNVPEMFIRVQTDGTITAKDALVQVIKKLMQDLSHLSREFTREFELRRMVEAGRSNQQGQ